ncbi:peptidylprolyl isomerase [Burkholderia pseudomallei]|nr:peptidylprolyl isomerase [Burkholderia pseudomallei]MPT67282.1 peptidylprolyl isomerase [Burkholderia pseudomallei]MPT74183.1 peptidylprolyl isomerase [Burkholderia pseudomallei]MPT79805.1 peptidylprolyl isomerase [Burkholderia pseudomallei]MPT87108.1 peptidylprolyl isomerase [Burkholderia pseudomallei]
MTRPCERAATRRPCGRARKRAAPPGPDCPPGRRAARRAPGFAG